MRKEVLIMFAEIFNYSTVLFPLLSGFVQGALMLINALFKNPIMLAFFTLGLLNMILKRRKRF